MSLKFDEICIDAHDASALGAWWAEVLGWPHDIDDDGDLRLHPPPGAGPDWIFLAVPDEKVVKNRIHLDFRPDDQQAEVDRVIGLGARHVDIGQGDAELGGARRPRGKRVLHPRPGRLTPPPRLSARQHAANWYLFAVARAASVYPTTPCCGGPAGLSGLGARGSVPIESAGGRHGVPGCDSTAFSGGAVHE